MIGHVIHGSNVCRLETHTVHTTFHKGLHCLLRQNLQRKKSKLFLEFITYDPSIYTLDHPDYMVCIYIENFICLKIMVMMMDSM